MPVSSRRCLLLGASAAFALGAAPVEGLRPAPLMAQEAAQEAAPEPEPSGRRRRRGRERPAKAASDKAASDKATSDKAGSVKTAPGMQQATPLAIFGDWNVFAMGQAKGRVCYAIAQPQARSPKTLKRDSAYFFVTVRKGENVQNEVAVMMGFPAKPPASQGKPPGTATGTLAPSDPTLNLGATRYGLVVKDGNAWLQNQGDETRVVTEMGRTTKLLVKATSMRGNPTSDEYALGGFSEALKQARDACK